MTSPCSNAGFMLPLDRSGVLHNEVSPLFVRSAGMKGRYAEPQCLFPEAKPSPDVDLLKRYCQAFKTLLASHVKMEDVILSNKRRRRQSRDVEAMLKNLNEIVSTPLKVRMSLGGAGDNVNLIERVAEPPAPASSATGKSPLRKALTPTRAQDVNQRREKGWNSSSSSSSKQSATAASPARSPGRNSAITQRKSAQRRAGGAATPRLASTASLAKSSPALAAAAASRGRERAAAADPFTLYFSLTSTPGSGSKAVLPLSMPTPSDLIALQSVTEEVRQELQHTKAGPGSREEVEREGGVEIDKEGTQRPLANTHHSSSSSSFSAASPARSPRALADPRRSFGLGGSAVRLSSGGLKLGAKSPLKSGATGLGLGQRQAATMQRSPHRSPLRSPRPASASRVGLGLGLGFGSSAATKRATPAPSPRSPRSTPASASASARAPGPGSARRALLQTADSLMAEIDSALMR